MILGIYRVLTIILSPFIDIFLLLRLYFKKEEKNRFLERLGFPGAKRPDGDLIWFQCASVGEGNSIMSLVDQILKLYNNKVHILITSGTVSSANVICKKIKNKENIIHQYTPVDKYFTVKRFLKFWKPKVLITVESEIWPNLITLSHKFCEKVMIVNAKMSEKSFSRWKKFKNLKETIFDSIDICYPQSEEDQYRFINLGIQNTIFLGNLKFDIPKLEIHEDYLKVLQNSIHNRKVLFCASLHLEEIEVLKNICNNLKSKYRDILFIIALRHPNDNTKVCEYFGKDGSVIMLKSKSEQITDGTNFYIYDEIGGMGTLFELCDIVLMCGSLVEDIGGHTPIEAAKQNCAILTGPYMKNNFSLYRELEKSDACIICKNTKKISEEISNSVSELFEDIEKQNRIRDNAKAVCERFSNVAKNVALNIIENLD